MYTEYSKQYYEANKKRILERQRERYQNKKKEILEIQHKYYNENKEKILEYQKKRYSENKEACLESNRKWEKENYNTPMRRAHRLIQSYNHSDLKLGRGKGDLTSKWIVENIFSKPCAHCGRVGWDVIGCNRLDNGKPHTMDNIEPCCEECNKKLPRK